MRTYLSHDTTGLSERTDDPALTAALAPPAISASTIESQDLTATTELVEFVDPDTGDTAWAVRTGNGQVCHHLAIGTKAEAEARYEWWVEMARFLSEHPTGRGRAPRTETQE